MYLENKLLLILINFTPKTSHIATVAYNYGTECFPGRIGKNTQLFNQWSLKFIHFLKSFLFTRI